MGNFAPYLLNLEIVNLLPTENIMKGNNEAHSITKHEQSQNMFLFGFLIYIHLPCHRQQVRFFVITSMAVNTQPLYLIKFLPPPTSIVLSEIVFVINSGIHDESG